MVRRVLNSVFSEKGLWLVLALFLARQTYFAISLEPTIDEGLWSWNARSAHWHFNSGGILHSVLSPVYYLLGRFTFLFVSPSIIAMRFANLLIFGVCLAVWMKRRSSAAERKQDLFLLLVLFIDPLFSRTVSWAVVEPLLVAEILMLHLYLQRLERQPTAWDARLLGIGVGIILATKLTAVWALGAGVIFLFWGQWSKSVLFFSYALLAALLLYVTVIVQSPGHLVWPNLSIHFSTRFLEIDIPSLIEHLNFRLIFEALLVLLPCLWMLLRQPTKLVLLSQPLCLAALLLMLTNAYNAAPRYLLPAAYFCLCTMLTSFQWKTKRGFISAGVMMGLAALVLTPLYFQGYLWEARNEGGWSANRWLEMRYQDGITHGIYAPPHVAFNIPVPVQPIGVGLLNNDPAFIGSPSLLVFQTSAILPLPKEEKLLLRLRRQKTPSETFGIYQVFDARKTMRALSSQ